MIFKKDMDSFLKQDLIYLKGMQVRLKNLKGATEFNPKTLNYDIKKLNTIVNLLNSLI